MEIVLRERELEAEEKELKKQAGEDKLRKLLEQEKNAKEQVMKRKQQKKDQKLAKVVTGKEKKGENEDQGNASDVRHLVGLLSVYRRFIPNFAKEAKPLYDLLKQEGGGQMSKTKQIEWTEAHQQITEKLIDIITAFPVMAYPEFDKPFVLHTDASYDGLGAVLYQEQDSELKVIAYASRTLLPAERNYHSNKLEFLCMKWSMCSAFRDYLYYAKSFTTITDTHHEHSTIECD